MSGEASRPGAPISARALSRRFGEHCAVDRLSLEVAPGEAFGLLGANGAGKTTFIRLVTGYLVPSDGEIRVDGISPVSEPGEVHARIGYVPETSRLYPELRVDDFLEFAGGARGLAGDALARAIERVLERFDLASVRRRLVGNLSKGFQQRVSLAQAFLHDPRLVIVDEPTGGLDPLQQQAVRRAVAAMRGRQTVLLCTHDLPEARELCDRVAVLSRGRLVALGPAERVLDTGDPFALFRGDASALPPDVRVEAPSP
ncbi:MAG: ABC transporter ATP-binding protein [Myxococcota bacterium]